MTPRLISATLLLAMLAACGPKDSLRLGYDLLQGGQTIEACRVYGEARQRYPRNEDVQAAWAYACPQAVDALREQAEAAVASGALRAADRIAADARTLWPIGDNTRALENYVAQSWVDAFTSASTQALDRGDVAVAAVLAAGAEARGQAADADALQARVLAIHQLGGRLVPGSRAAEPLADALRAELRYPLLPWTGADGFLATVRVEPASCSEEVQQRGAVHTYVHHIRQDPNPAWQDLEARRLGAEARRDEQRRALHGLQDEVERLGREADIARVQLEAQLPRTAQASAAVEQARAAHAEAKARHARAAEALQALEQQAEDALHHREGAEATVQAAREAVQRADAVLVEVRGRQEETRAACEDAARGQPALEQALQDHRAAVGANKATLAEAQEAVQGAQAALAALRDALGGEPATPEQRAQMAAARAEVEAATQARAQAQSTLTEAEARLAEAAAAVEDGAAIQQSCQALDAQRQEAEAAKAQAVADLDAALAARAQGPVPPTEDALRQARRELNTATRVLEDATLTLSEARRALDVEQARQAPLEARLADVQAAWQARAAERDQSRERLEALRVEHDRLAAQLAETPPLMDVPVYADHPYVVKEWTFTCRRPVFVQLQGPGQPGGERRLDVTARVQDESWAAAPRVGLAGDPHGYAISEDALRQRLDAQVHAEARAALGQALAGLQEAHFAVVTQGVGRDVEATRVVLTAAMGGADERVALAESWIGGE
ncbi:MAG: hypothetical protein H6739_26570 [Alphaproteobacteria bacterium]|nr:hypothetical protein [Alphaproteobacteria bacterium]